LIGNKKETFTVTLHKLDDPQEIEAEFEHIVYQDGKVKLRFAGITRLARLDSTAGLAMLTFPGDGGGAFRNSSRQLKYGHE
jgi:hypothetical protein